MYAEELLLKGCFKSEAGKIKSVNEILYAEDETGRYVVLDGCAAFRINNMFNTETVCKMLHKDRPFTGIGKMFEKDDFEVVFKICELERNGKTLIQFNNECGTECYMNKKYFDILKKIEKETPFGCPLYYSPSGKIFAVDVLDQKTAIVLPVLH